MYGFMNTTIRMDPHCNPFHIIYNYSPRFSKPSFQCNLVTDVLRVKYGKGEKPR
ncbi:hypothetical protein K456DRAFT_52532 [Colletotrichum gloeosporioides 23]|nr:hypothetical protein K456DRAFT_52532 [Colletotrichum gloeosporioides 23]